MTFDFTVNFSHLVAAGVGLLMLVERRMSGSSSSKTTVAEEVVRVLREEGLPTVCPGHIAKNLEGLKHDVERLVEFHEAVDQDGVNRLWSRDQGRELISKENHILSLLNSINTKLAVMVGRGRGAEG